MGFTTYPTAENIEALMRSTQFWPADEYPNQQALARDQCVIAAEAAKDEWEHIVGWEPFLADEDVTTRYFDGVDHSGFLDLQGGAISISSVTISGNAQTVNSNYWTYPKSAAAKNQAITGLDFRGYGISGYNRSQYVVTARWGRVTEVPGDVWQAIQQKAASIVLTQIPNLQSIASISQDGFTKSFDVVGIVTQKDLAAGGMGGAGLWGRSFETIFKRWKRVVS